MLSSSKINFVIKSIRVLNYFTSQKPTVYLKFEVSGRYSELWDKFTKVLLNQLG